ncbi:uncharacterized protein LOC143342192 [Colletes latitarsis]|uniref:uncharacterized protein LOC143342192 n=1 Tax=Colletes latitarsis TaxID=2605962 RepID=UPI004036855E
MKLLIAFCFLAALCALQVSAYNAFDQLKWQVERSRNNVNSIMRNIRTNRNSLSNSITMKLSNLEIQSMTNINNYVNPTLNQIRSDVDAAKANGTDAEQCYINAKSELRSISLTGFSDLKQCKERGESDLQVQLNVLVKLEAIGNNYLNELSLLFSRCYSSDSMQMQSCIAIKLGNINNSIRFYENTANSQIRDSERIANRAVVEASSCNLNAVSKVYPEVTKTKINASKCIKG